MKLDAQGSVAAKLDPAAAVGAEEEARAVRLLLEDGAAEGKCLATGGRSDRTAEGAAGFVERERELVAAEVGHLVLPVDGDGIGEVGAQIAAEE